MRKPKLSVVIELLAGIIIAYIGIIVRSNAQKGQFENTAAMTTFSTVLLVAGIVILIIGFIGVGINRRAAYKEFEKKMAEEQGIDLSQRKQPQGFFARGRQEQPSVRDKVNRYSNPVVDVDEKYITEKEDTEAKS